MPTSSQTTPLNLLAHLRYCPYVDYVGCMSSINNNSNILNGILYMSALNKPTVHKEAIDMYTNKKYMSHPQNDRSRLLSGKFTLPGTFFFNNSLLKQLDLTWLTTHEL